MNLQEYEQEEHEIAEDIYRHRSPIDKQSTLYPKMAERLGINPAVPHALFESELGRPSLSLAQACAIYPVVVAEVPRIRDRNLFLAQFGLEHWDEFTELVSAGLFLPVIQKPTVYEQIPFLSRFILKYRPPSCEIRDRFAYGPDRYHNFLERGRHIRGVRIAYKYPHLREAQEDPASEPEFVTRRMEQRYAAMECVPFWNGTYFERRLKGMAPKVQAERIFYDHLVWVHPNSQGIGTSTHFTDGQCQELGSGVLQNGYHLPLQVLSNLDIQLPRSLTIGRIRAFHDQGVPEKMRAVEDEIRSETLNEASLRQRLHEVNEEIRCIERRSERLARWAPLGACACTGLLAVASSVAASIGGGLQLAEAINAGTIAAGAGLASMGIVRAIPEREREDRCKDIVLMRVRDPLVRYGFYLKQSVNKAAD